MSRNLTLREFLPPLVFRFLRSLRHRNDDGGAEAITPFTDPSLKSYSQFNEDLILDQIFDLDSPGFYVDIGANDPVINNNTKRFYDQGWSGINIEPVVEKFDQLCAARSRDTNLNIGIGPNSGQYPFYRIVGDSTLSSFDKDSAQDMALKYKLEMEERKIEVLTLEDFYYQYLKSRSVELMSLDAEGLDLAILKSNDWKLFRPMVLIVEIDKAYKELLNFMEKQNYRRLFNNYHNGIFIDKAKFQKGTFKSVEKST